MGTENLFQAGQVIIEEATLISADGSNKIGIDLTSIEIDVYEDMFSPTMYGTATLVENFNLILNLPIIGEETFYLKFKTPTSASVIEKAFRVFKVSQREFENVKKHIYVIHFASIETVVDISTKINHAMEGTPSECAKKLFESKFPRTKLNVTPSTNIIKYVAPTISPFTALSVLANKAINNESIGMADYLFFENNQSFNFVSLSALHKQPEKRLFRYSFSQQRLKTADGESSRDINAEFENVKAINFAEVTDSLKRKMDATYGHKVWEVDMLRKSFRKHTYDAQQDFSKHSHLDKLKPFSKYEHTNPETVVEVMPVHAHTHKNIKVDRDAEILCKRPVALGQANWIAISFVAHGDTQLKAGDVIRFEMPLGETSDDTDKYKSDKLDPYYTGKYLVSAIKHRLTINKHEMEIEAIKDSFMSEIDFQRAGR